MSLLLEPDRPDMLEDMLRFMVQHKTPVAIRGGGSKAALGRPVEAERTLDLSRLAGIELYEPDELVLSAAAGTRLAHIEAALSNHRQMLAFEPIDYGPLLGLEPGQGTIGGVLAANLAGPRRVKMGAARDHFLGFSAVSGRGEAYKAGGRVVKNVTGYDLCKLLAGSWGTLSVLSRVTIKVLPAPEDSRSILLESLDVPAAVAAMTEALQSPHEVSGAARLPSGETAIRIEGFAPSVAARTEALLALLSRHGEPRVADRAESGTLWRSVRDVLPFARDRSRPVWRVSIPPAACPAVVAAIGAAVDAGFLIDWGGGLVWVETRPDGDAGQAAIRAAVAPAGGHATLVRASAEQRATLDVFEPPAPGVAAQQRRVKAGFDPLGLLNPGRMYADG